LIHLTGLTIHHEKFPCRDFYPFNLEIFQNTSRLEFKKDITFFTGENGTGKSTLLRAAAMRCGIHIWQSEFNLRCNPNPYEEDLYKTLSIQWDTGPVPGSFFGSQIFQHFAKNLEEWAMNDEKMLDYFGGRSLITQSHGQSLMSYFKSRYRIKGVYFLDEPETALSPSSLIELLNLLLELNNQGHAQFIIATHSPFLLACPKADILNFTGSKISPVKYKDTAYYRIYKEFMNHPERFINQAPSPAKTP
jgi:predicted ATPase